MTTGPLLLSGAMAAVFVAIHLFIGRIRFLDVVPRSGWLSFAGGVAVTYVFLDILPEIGAHAAEFAEQFGRSEAASESVVYSLALLGVVAFYGLERRAQLRLNRDESGAIDSAAIVYHVLTYGMFSLLIGYLLMQREAAGTLEAVIYFAAMSLHFVTADFALFQDDREGYQRLGRWILAGCVTTGCVLGLLVQLPPTIIGCFFAFVAGGIILNVLKEELPEEKQSAFVPFVGGVLLCGIIVLAERHVM